MSISVAVLLSACGEWNSNHGDSASADSNANPESSNVQVSDSDFRRIDTQTNGFQANVAQTDLQLQTTFSGSCSAESPPGGISRVVVSPNNPVDVPKHFMGMHLGLHIPSWKAGAYSAIPAPTYDYGYSRTLK
ncbi:MAG: hypothetical protein AB8C46_16215, partial [Burkholderiaceae bacterium]